jgi:Ca-activated chloride channel homolog
MRLNGNGTDSISRFFLQLVAFMSVAVTAVAVPLSTPSGSFRKGWQEREQRRGGPAIRLGTQLVSLRVTVTDRKGNLIDELSKEDFKIYDDKIEQPISFFSNEDTPISVGIIFDTSGSMSGPRLRQGRDALARFIETSHKEDDYFLMGFNSTPHLLLDWMRGGQDILGQISNVYPNGPTALYDAVYQGIEKVSSGTYSKRAIILISDGEDNRSQCSFGKLRRRLQESDVTLYAIGTRMNTLPQKGRIGVSGGLILDKLASVSGGKAFYPKNPGEMTEAFERIALELRRQYSIGYLPSNFKADGKWHRIKIVVTDPQESSGLVVRGREGYYTVKNSF